MTDSGYNRPSNDNINMLQQVSGADPVEAALSDEVSTLPPSGWLVIAALRPGRYGSVRIVSYDRIEPFQVGDERENPAVVPYVQTFLRLSEQRASSVLYEPENAPEQDEEPLFREEEARSIAAFEYESTTTQLSESGQLVAAAEELSPGLRMEELLKLYRDPGDEREDDDNDNSLWCNRVTNDPEVLRSILWELAVAMGISNEADAQLFVNTALDGLNPPLTDPGGL